MDDAKIDKLATNTKALPKMASAWVITIVSSAAAWFFAQPEAAQQNILAAIPVDPVWLPVISGLVALLARAWPQASITPAVAAAKSDDDEGPPTEPAAHYGTRGPVTPRADTHL